MLFPHAKAAEKKEPWLHPRTFAWDSRENPRASWNAPHIFTVCRVRSFPS